MVQGLLQGLEPRQVEFWWQLQVDEFWRKSFGVCERALAGRQIFRRSKVISCQDLLCPAGSLPWLHAQ